MKIQVLNEDNKLAAAKAVGIVAMIPLILIATVVGLFINPVVVGYAWFGLCMLVIGGFILFVAGALLVIGICNAYLALYAYFSGTEKRIF